MVQTLFVFTLLYFAFSQAATPNDIGTKKIVTLKRLAQCTSKRNLNVILENAVIIPEKNHQTLQFRYMVKNAISKNFLMKVTIRKCDPSGNPDACEYVVKDHNITNVCSIIKQRDEKFTPYLDNLDMPQECPIKKGEYSLNKTTITEDIFVYAPSADKIWKVQFKGFDGDFNILCIDMEAAVKIVQDSPQNGNKKTRKNIK